MKKKHLKILLFYKCILKITVIWCMVPEICSATDRIFLSFWTVFGLLPLNNPKNQNFRKMKETPGDIILHMCNKNDSHMMYGSWPIEHDRQNFLSFWTIFYTFTTPKNPKNQNFEEKKKKPPGDIIILHMCTININHMMNSSRDMEHDGQNFLSFWTFFLPFYPPNNLKNQNFGKMIQTPGDKTILHKCTKNDSHMMYGSWAWWTKFFCHFGQFFALSPP